LNVVDVALDKPLDESPWASGYHVELFLGPVGNAMGLPNNIRQAYVTLRTPVGNGIDWKVGIFDTIVGYESTTAANNPNYSKSYGYNIEPTTHTGILGAYKINDMFSFQAGMADTAYAGGGLYTASTVAGTGLYSPTFMVAPTFTAPESFGWAKGMTVTGGYIVTGGNTGTTVGAPHSGSNGAGASTYYVGATVPTANDKLKFGAAFDYLTARDISADEWALGVYGTYQFNDKLSLNLRFETFRDNGVNSSGALDYGPGVVNGKAQEITATLQYALWANVLTRLEVRWDHSDDTANGYVSNEGNLEQDAFMLAAQAIYTF